MLGLSQNLGNEGDLGCLGTYYLRWGRRGRTCGSDSLIQGSYFHCRAARGLVELECSKSLCWTFSPRCRWRALARPSLPVGSFSGCEPRSICRAPLGQLLPHCPSPTFSSAGSDCGSPKAGFSLPECPPLPWQCHLQFPPATCPPWQQGGQPHVCLLAESMHGSFSPPKYIRNVRGLVQKHPTFGGPWSPNLQVIHVLRPSSLIPPVSEPGLLWSLPARLLWCIKQPVSLWLHS